MIECKIQNGKTKFTGDNGMKKSNEKFDIKLIGICYRDAFIALLSRIIYNKQDKRRQYVWQTVMRKKLKAALARLLTV